MSRYTPHYCSEAFLILGCPYMVITNELYDYYHSFPSLQRTSMCQTTVAMAHPAAVPVQAPIRPPQSPRADTLQRTAIQTMVGMVPSIHSHLVSDTLAALVPPVALPVYHSRPQLLEIESAFIVADREAWV